MEMEPVVPQVRTELALAAASSLATRQVETQRLTRWTMRLPTVVAPVQGGEAAVTPPLFFAAALRPCVRRLDQHSRAVPRRVFQPDPATALAARVLAGPAAGPLSPKSLEVKRLAVPSET